MPFPTARTRCQGLVLRSLCDGRDGNLRRAAVRRHPGPGLGSVQTAQVRTFAALLQAPPWLSAEERDPWWTLMVFFNSLRELGTSLSLLQSDIPDYLKAFGTVRAEAPRRGCRDLLELTGRLRNDEVPKAIGDLSATTWQAARAVDPASRRTSSRSESTLSACR